METKTEMILRTGISLLFILKDFQCQAFCGSKISVCSPKFATLG